MSTIVTDTITGKSTATTITIGSTPVVSASANSMTIRGEGSNQTSIQQGLGKVWCAFDMIDDSDYILDSFNSASFTDHTTGSATITFSNAMSSTNYSATSMTNGQSDSREFNVLCFDLKQNQAGSLPATGFLKVENLAGSSGSGGTSQDPSYACLTIHGDLS